MHQACLFEFRQVVKQLADSWLALIAPPAFHKSAGWYQACGSSPEHTLNLAALGLAVCHHVTALQ